MICWVYLVVLYVSPNKFPLTRRKLGCRWLLPLEHVFVCHITVQNSCHLFGERLRQLAMRFLLGVARKRCGKWVEFVFLFSYVSDI